MARTKGARFSFDLEREDIPFREACDVALRMNPRRRFLFVSRVLGRHWPTRPAAHRMAAGLLAASVARRVSGRSALIVGMAETATTLGQSVFAALVAQGIDAAYIESSRRRTGGGIAFEFDESHSHARLHGVHEPLPGTRIEHAMRSADVVAVVDDEATTGRTAAECVRALEAWSGRSREAMLAVLLHWHAPDGGASGGLSVESLVSGRFAFSMEDGLSLPMAEAPTASASEARPVRARRGPRHGLDVPERLGGLQAARVSAGERVLVVGTGEHGYRPLLLAEEFERQGAVAWVQATTRSPVLAVGAVTHARAFPALSGEGHAEYLYNVPDDHGYDRIVLFTEDDHPTAGHPVLGIPRLEVLR